MQLREEYYLDGVECDPFSFDMECKELNAHFHKNQKYDEIKSHHYIISFDPKDRDECGLTGEKAQQPGLAYCKKNFLGHQALVCTHTDGHNGSGNIQTKPAWSCAFIVINSLRKNDVERQDFMERDCDSRTGNKHHLTNNYLVYLKQSLMDLCTRENLHQVDLLAKAERKVTEKEYLMGMIENNSHVENTGKDQTVQKEILSTENNIAPERPAYQQKTPDGTNMPAAIFEKSGLRLVTDLQHCIKAQQSKAYANKVKLSNLQNMARTLAYVQEHSPELALYEAAVKFLKEKSSDGKLPNLQTLKAEKEKLLVQKKEAQEKYYYYRDYQKELNTVCTNIHAALEPVNNRPGHSNKREERI